MFFLKSHNYLRQFLKGLAKINIAHKPVVVFYFIIIHVSNVKHCISVQRHWIPCGWFVVRVVTQILFKIPFSSRRKTAMPVKVTKFRSSLGAYGLWVGRDFYRAIPAYTGPRRTVPNVFSGTLGLGPAPLDLDISDRTRIRNLGNLNDALQQIPVLVLSTGEIKYIIIIFTKCKKKYSDKSDISFIGNRIGKLFQTI